ncbi:MAG TPA: SDR family NAD(P)-dependent oxidoreductase, partial [Chloroflexota bacterium]|nr:SDR family NAD(P)-dependent oxidoreductase [Chloroflexota bacterium]
MSIFDRFRIDGRVALITGASHGIGAGLALAMAQAGADVVLAARSAGELEGVARSVRAIGRRALAVPTDVADLAQIEHLLERAAGEVGEPDILANVAGLTRRKPILDVLPEDWEYVLNVNLRGVYFTSQAFARRLVARKAGYGKVLNIASMTSYRGFDGLSLYGIS